MSVLKRFFGWILFYLLDMIWSERGKRIFFIATLQAQLRGSSDLDDVELSKINSVLHLFSDKDALNLPFALYELVWQKRGIDQLAQELVAAKDADLRMQMEIARSVSARIIEASPKWMRYGKGDTKKMMDDLLQLLTIQPVRVPTHA